MSESNPIRVFTSHSFEESDDYLRLFEFLESVDRFYYLNTSKPENVPTIGGIQAIKDELIEQIKAAEAVVVFASLYDQKTELVRFMMDVADANSIKMIGVKPYGHMTEPAEELTARCAEVVEWNERTLVDALKRQARGEDTARWEVIDFPGFDADGPIED